MGTDIVQKKEDVEMITLKRKNIHDFAMKWRDRFCNRDADHVTLLNPEMIEECAKLGIEMDYGHVFSKKYGEADKNHKALDKVIHEVKDLGLLGSAVYSRWGAFYYGLEPGSEIASPQNRTWFNLALTQMIALSEKNPLVFRGQLKKVQLISNILSYGYIPSPDEEVEQHLTIDNDGCTEFSGYRTGLYFGTYEERRTSSSKVGKTEVNDLFSAIEAYFGDENYTEIFVLDGGMWEMELTNTEGTVYRFQGSLCANFEYKGNDLSDMVRDLTGICDLFVFDGNFVPTEIDQITIDYHNVINLNSGEFENGKPEVKDHYEQICISREAGIFMYKQNTGDGCKITWQCEDKDAVGSLLDHFDADELFSYVEGNPDDVVDSPDQRKDYTITIKYNKVPDRIIEGSFDRKGLPDDFTSFAQTVVSFIRLGNIGEMLTASNYGRKKRRKSECIFCSVVFQEGSKSYYYLTDDDSIDVGDYVIVPVGKERHEKIVEVVKVEYFTEEQAPLPPDVTKKIIRKCSMEELDE